MGGARRASSGLVRCFRNAAARNCGTSVHRQVGSSQGLNQQQDAEQNRLRDLTPGALASNCLRSVHTLNSEFQRRRRNVPVVHEGLVPNAGIKVGSFADRRRPGTWFGERYFSAGAHSDSESQRKGLPESQIGQELLKNQSSSGSSPSDASQGLKLAHGETLSPEEEARLKEAEAKYESGQIREEEAVSVESIQEMLKDLAAVADPNDPRIAIVSLRLGQEYEARGEDPRTFLKLGEQALKIFKRVGGFPLEIGMCHHLLALALHRLKSQHRCLEELKNALSILEGTEGKESAPVKFAVQFLMGDALAAVGRHEDSLQHYVEGLALQETVMDDGHPQLANNYRRVAEAFIQVMLFDPAKSLIERALESHLKLNGKGSMDEASDRRLLAAVYSGLEEHEKALEEQQTVRSILHEKGLGSEALFVEIAIADTQTTLRRFDDAIATLQNAISQLEEGTMMRALATVNLAKAYTWQGNIKKGEELSRAVIALLDSKVEGLTGADTELLAAGECYTGLSGIYVHLDQPDEAIALLKTGLAIYKQLPQHMNATAGAQAQIGMLLLFSRKENESIPYMEEAASNLRMSLGGGHYSLGLVLNHLAVAHVELKNMTKAVEFFEEAKSIYSKTHGPGHEDTLAIHYNLMKVYETMGRKEEAIANAKIIVAELEKQGEPAKSALAGAQNDLAILEESQSISSPESTQ